MVHAGPIDKAGDSDVIVLDGGARRHFKVVQGQKEVEDNIIKDPVLNFLRKGLRNEE